MQMGFNNSGRLETVSEAEPEYRIKLVWGRALVELGLFSGNVRLNCGIGADRAAKQTGGVARATTQVQRHTRRSLIGSANIKSRAEVPVAWHQIAESEEKHGRCLIH